MKHDDHYHCDACGAEFRTESELDKHNQEKHSMKADSRLNSPGINDSRMPNPDAHGSDHQGRTFERGSKE